MRAPAVLAPLRHRDFRLLLVGQTVSSVGNSFFLVALPFQLLALGASPLQLGVAVTILTGSSLLFLLLGGAVADRVPRRWLILANDALGGTVTAVVALLAWTGLLRVEHLYVAAAMLGAAFAFLYPAYTAIVTELIPDELLNQGNAARMLGARLASTAGPLAAGVTIGVFGLPLAFAIDALTFNFSFFLFLAAAPAARRRSPGVPLLRQVRDGIAFVLATPWLWTALLGLAFINLSYGGQRGVLTPLFVRDSLHGDAATFGLVTAAFGIGAIVGGLVIAELHVARPGIAMYAFETVAGLATIAIGFVVWLPATLAGMAVMGLALSSSDTLFTAALQRNVPQEMLGRVTSINFLVASLFVPVAPLGAAALVAVVGPPGTFVIAGVIAAGLALVLMIVSPVRSLR